MNIMKRFTALVFALIALTSCITTHSIQIDQMEPGQIPLPPKVRKVALISRNFKFSIDTLRGYYKHNLRLFRGLRIDNQQIDSLAVTKTLDELQKILLGSGRFDEVFVYPYNAILPNTADKEIPLSSGFIQSICNESQTDAIVSLEMLSYFYSTHNQHSGHDTGNEANTKVSSIWSVYTPQISGPLERYSHSEIIKWNERDLEIKGKKINPPDRKTAIPVACGIAAKNYSKRLVPYWAESSRVVVSLDRPDFDKALSLALKNKWKEASIIWEKYSTNAHPKISGIASLNNAVAQEMIGDYRKASFYSDKSVKLLQSGESGKIARAYAAILYNRKQKVSNLDSLLTPGHN